MPDEKRKLELEKLVLKYQKSYYAAEGEIEDSEFDKLWDELKELDPENEIFKKIGSDLSSGTFEKAQHLIPMGSQEKAADPNAFRAWATKMTFSDFLVEYKLDGASLEMQYENGEFVKAVTRGDGVIGDDITRNVLKMQGVVRSLKDKTLTGGVRGEVLMFHDVHKELYSDKANCRNAANGLMKRKDGTGSEHLCVICYDARFVDADGKPSAMQPFTTESEKIDWLIDNGFKTVPLFRCNGIDSVIEYRVKVMELRPSLDYDIDGLVIKNDKIDFADADRARPEKQIAFKFSLEEAVTILRKVEWSESGATYTPIGIFDTVDLAGTKVSRASLANPDIMRSLGVEIGSHVVVTKRGEIIPKIEYVLPPENLADKKTDSDSLFELPELLPIQFPTKCSVCGSELVDEGTRLYCPNLHCSKRIHHRLEKWISVLDIRDLGETLIKRLFDSGVVRAIADLYKLTEEVLTPFFLNEESIQKEKKSLGAAKVVQAINAKRKITLAKFIAGLDIEGIGEVLVEKLVDAGFNTLDEILKADESAISAVNGFGEITAHNLVQGLKDTSEEISALTGSDDKPLLIEAPKTGGLLTGKTFCFTGELFTMKRSEAENLVKQQGGSAKSSVVKGLTYLVTNDKTSGSAKNKKAAELSIPVIDEKEFRTLIGLEN